MTLIDIVINYAPILIGAVGVFFGLYQRNQLKISRDNERLYQSAIKTESRRASVAEQLFTAKQQLDKQAQKNIDEVIDHAKTTRDYFDSNSN